MKSNTRIFVLIHARIACIAAIVMAAAACNSLKLPGLTDRTSFAEESNESSSVASPEATGFDPAVEETPREESADALGHGLLLRPMMFPVRIVCDGNKQENSRKVADDVAKRFEKSRLYAEQKHPQWCWAACAQMVLHYRNINMFLNKEGTRVPATQTDLAHYFKGSNEEQGADYLTIMRAISPECESKIDKTDAASLSLLGMTSDVLVQSLSKDRLPVIVGLNYDGFTHACVLTSVTYTRRDKTVNKLTSGAVDLFANHYMKDKEKKVAEAAWKAGKFMGEHPELTKTGTKVFGGWSAYMKDDYIIESVAGFDPQPESPYEAGAFVMTGTELQNRCVFLVTPRLATEMLVGKKQSINAETIAKAWFEDSK